MQIIIYVLKKKHQYDKYYYYYYYSCQVTDVSLELERILLLLLSVILR